MKTAFVLVELFFFGILNGMAIVAANPGVARLPVFFALPVYAEGWDDYLQTGGATYTAGVTCGLWIGAVV